MTAGPFLPARAERTRGISSRIAAAIVGAALASAALVAVAAPAAADGTRPVPGTIFFTDPGASVSSFAPGGPVTLFASSVFGVTVDGFGNVYTLGSVVDPVTGPTDPGTPPVHTSHQEVREYPADGSPSIVIGATASSDGGFQNGNIAADAVGDVFWNDNSTGTTWKINLAARTQTVVGSGFQGLAGVAVDGAGNVYIAEYGQSRLWRSTGDGTGTPTVVATNTGNGQGVTTDAAGNVYYTSLQNGSVVRIAPNGAKTTVASGLSQPAGIDTDLRGNLVVADMGGTSPRGRVLSVPVDGGPVTVLATASYTYMVAVYRPSAAAFTAANPPAGSYGTDYRYTYKTAAAAGSTLFGLASGALPPGLTLDPATGVLAGTPTRVGEYSFTVSGTTGAVTSAAPVTVFIGPAALRATVTGTRVYGGADSFAATGVTGLVAGDTSSVLTGTLACTTSPAVTAHVGTYTGSIGGCSGLHADNYVVLYADGGFTVSPATATVTVTGAQTYGGVATFSVAGVTGAPSVSGTLSGCTTTTAATTPTGTYAGTISGCTGLTADGDHTLTYVDGGYTVDPAVLTATVVGRGGYGGTLAYTVDGWSGFVGGDTADTAVTGALTGCTSSAAGGGAGSYAATISGCGGLTSGNYTIAYADGGTTITPAPLTVTASSATSSFGQTPPTPTASYSGFVGGDSVASLTSAATCSAPASATSPAGTYATTCGGVVAPNYAITYVPGQLTIAPATVGLAYTGPTQVTAGAGFTPTATLTGPLGCSAGQTVTFTLDANPVTGAAGPYVLATAVTTSAGTATAPTVATGGWTAGARTLTAATTGTVSCLATSATSPVAVVAAGQVAAGAGTYSGAGGVTAFALGAVPVGRTGTYLGGISLTTAGAWWYTATVSTYTRTGTGQGVLTGTGTLWSWNAGANRGRGGWVVARTGVPVTVTAVATTKASPARIAVQLGAVAPAGARPLPTVALTAVRSGAIAVS